MRALCLAIVAAFVPPLVLAEPPDVALSDIIAKVRAMRKATDFRASGRLVRVATSGKRNACQVSMKAKALAGGLRLFCEITDPPPARVRVLLETPPSGTASVRLGHAGDKAPTRLRFESWADPFVDSNLSYEDLLEGHFLWEKQSLVGEAKYGARNCRVIKSEPGTQDRSHYSAVTSWLDRETCYPVRTEKVMKGSGAVKEFLYYGLRESKGIWSASQIEVRIKGKTGSTFLVITRGSAKANLGDGEFDPALLTKGPR